MTDAMTIKTATTNWVREHVCSREELAIAPVCGGMIAVVGRTGSGRTVTAIADHWTGWNCHHQSTVVAGSETEDAARAARATAVAALPHATWHITCYAPGSIRFRDELGWDNLPDYDVESVESIGATDYAPEAWWVGLFPTAAAAAAWVAGCYRVGVNPLPKLREKLPWLSWEYDAGTVRATAHGPYYTEIPAR